MKRINRNKKHIISDLNGKLEDFGQMLRVIDYSKDEPYIKFNFEIILIDKECCNFIFNNILRKPTDYWLLNIDNVILYKICDI